MRLLAFDTAGDGCSAGIFVAARPLALRRHGGAQGHAERLPLLLAEVLEAAGCPSSALDALAVTIGPGSFSGIRTGLAAARGLALATGLPVFGVTTFAALAVPLARASADPRPIAAVIDARRGQVYVQLFDVDGQALAQPLVATPEAAAAGLRGPHRLVGSGAALLLPHLRQTAASEMIAAPLDAEAVAVAAEAGAALGVAPVVGTMLAPLYLRDADARPDAGRPLLPVEG